MQHKWDQAFGKEKKYGIQELRLPHTKTIGEDKPKGGFIFLLFRFSTDLRSLQAPAISLIRPWEGENGGSTPMGKQRGGAKTVIEAK